MSGVVTDGFSWRLEKPNISALASQQMKKKTFFLCSLQEYSTDYEDKAMSSLFHLVCQLYKVRTELSWCKRL